MLVDGGIRCRHSDFQPPLQGDVPVLSQAANGEPWRGRTLLEPTLRPAGWQEASRATPTVSYGTLRTRQFEHEAAPTYKSEVPVEEQDHSREEAVLQAAIDHILSFPMKSPDDVPSGLASRPDLIRLEFGSLVRYPAFQFRSDARTQDLIEEINERLDAREDPWAVASWWFAPNHWTEDRAMPIELLDDPSRHDELASLAKGEVADHQTS